MGINFSPEFMHTLLQKSLSQMRSHGVDTRFIFLVMASDRHCSEGFSMPLRAKFSFLIKTLSFNLLYNLKKSCVGFLDVPITAISSLSRENPSFGFEKVFDFDTIGSIF